MKLFIRTILSSSLIILICLGQNSCKPKDANTKGDFKTIIEQVSKEFNLQDISYLVTKGGEVMAQKYANSSADIFPLVSDQKIENTFKNPILLDLLIKDSIVDGDSSLSKYFTTVRNKGIKIRDLTIIPADNFEPESFCSDSVYFMTDSMVKIARQSKKTYGNNLIQALTDSTEKATDTKSLIERLSFISILFDKTYIEYAPSQDSIVANIFPTWYTKNKSLFFGWKVLKFQGNTILWHCFQDKDLTLMLLKFMDKNIFAAISYRSKSVSTPYTYNRDDILQSPIALSLIKSVILPKDKNVNIDYTADWDSINNKFSIIGNSPSRIIYTKDLIAHARYYEVSGDVKNAKKLYTGYQSLTKDSLLVKYINETPIAETGYISDNSNTTANFNIRQDGYYQIFSGGQVLKVSGYNTTPYESDNVQLYFSKYSTSKTDQDQLQVFHFNYRLNKIAGMQDDRHSDNWLKQSNIRFAYSDPSDTSYILEVAIPWKEIRGKNPRNSTPLKLNILIGDSDYEENKRESILSWSTKPGEAWNNPLTYGTLYFNNTQHKSTQKTYRCRPVAHPIIIDGRIDKIWDKVHYSSIALPYYDKVTPFDNSGKFKSLYDKKYLYFLFYIGDNCKNKTGIITKDKCWIEETSTGQLIWKLPADTTNYLPSYSIEKKIYLKAGKYNLRYLSDRGHSFEGWYGIPPYNDIYGGIIYKVKK